MIDLHATYTKVLQASHPGVGMKYLLPVITDLIKTRILPKKKYTLSFPPVVTFPATEISHSTSPIRHAYFWPQMQEFILEGDIIVAEPGTAFFGALDMRLPKDAVILAQFLWNSIGYGTAACSGAAVAARREFQAQKGLNRKRRVVGLLGDGSFQLTNQEISTMVREGVSGTLFLLNNKGYTIGLSSPMQSLIGREIYPRC
jgi:pyruvate decarboxylase